MRRRFFPDFLFLMEVKQQSKCMVYMKKELGYDDMTTVEPIGLSGGLAVMWKKNFKVDILSRDKRIIDLKVQMGSMVFSISCVYGDPARNRRNRVSERLTDIGLVQNEPWLLVGDFNELMNNEEKLGGSSRHESTFWDFRHMAENCKIKELRSVGNQLSWAGKRDNVWIQCRLDRSFGNDQWFQLFPRAQMEYMSLWASDHRPLRVALLLRVMPQTEEDSILIKELWAEKEPRKLLIEVGTTASIMRTPDSWTEQPYLAEKWPNGNLRVT